MGKDRTVRDWWVVTQIAEIRMLERELADALRNPAAHRTDHGKQRLERRVAHLKSCVDALDHALAAPAFQ